MLCKIGVLVSLVHLFWPEIQGWPLTITTYTREDILKFLFWVQVSLKTDNSDENSTTTVFDHSTFDGCGDGYYCENIIYEGVGYVYRVLFEEGGLKRTTAEWTPPHCLRLYLLGCVVWIWLELNLGGVNGVTYLLFDLIPSCQLS